MIFRFSIGFSEWLITMNKRHIFEKGEIQYPRINDDNFCIVRMIFVSFEKYIIIMFQWQKSTNFKKTKIMHIFFMRFCWTLKVLPEALNGWVTTDFQVYSNNGQKKTLPPLPNRLWKILRTFVARNDRNRMNHNSIHNFIFSDTFLQIEFFLTNDKLCVDKLLVRKKHSVFQILKIYLSMFNDKSFHLYILFLWNCASFSFHFCFSIYLWSPSMS